VTLSIHPLEGIGEVATGDDLGGMLLATWRGGGLGIVDGDVLVVTHKVVSKAEGRIRPAPDDAAYRSLAAAEAAAVLRRRGDLIIARTRHGFICANAGVDRSNAPEGMAVLLPDDADRSAHGIRARIEHESGARIAVIVTDTFGRAWRRGLSDVAIGVSGMDPILDLRGSTDSHGRTLEVTEVAIADEIAAAADLVMGKASGIPAAVVRGLEWEPGEGRAVDLVRPAAEDFFR
jgi:coenzyme F420-0:L-glutamate ligase / coenzyme F420-1:gamma-L-glutamate ligase